MSRNYVWVVEIKFERSDVYAPTVGCGITRKDALAEARRWERKNAGCKCRVRRYQSTVS